MRSYALPTILVCVLLVLVVIPISMADSIEKETIAKEAGVSSEAEQYLWLQAGVFDPANGIPDHFKITHTDYYIIQFKGPIQDGWKKDVSLRGARLFGYIPDFGFMAHIDDVQSVESYRNVRAVVPYIPEFKYDMDECLGRSRFTAWVLEDRDTVMNQLQAMGLTIDPGTSFDHNIVFTTTSDVIPQIAMIPQVEFIEPIPEFNIVNSVASGIMGVNDVWTDLGLYGDGETVAFADTGLDTGVDNHSVTGDVHADFDDRVTFFNWKGTGPDDKNGHGTHVAGSIAGDGTRSAGSIRGMAPNASIICQGIGDDGGSTTMYVPGNISLLFQEAYDNGARVHSNSWGSIPALGYGDYDTWSRYVDEFIWHNQNMTILFAVGNDGTDGNSDGVVDTNSLMSPATAKNCISVGASENYRVGGSFTATYGTWKPANFPANPIASDTLANNTDGMAGFSSRGPTHDSRIKPDLVAPGTYILSTKSSVAGTGIQWLPFNGFYLYSGGTSMSTPLTAGTAVLVRQWLQQNHSHDGSAALVKALLINGATDMQPGQYGGGTSKDVTGWPDNNKGWGRVNVADSIEYYDDVRRVEFEDDKTGVTSSNTKSYSYGIVSNSHPLEITLAWSDFPATTTASVDLVNDLDLTIEGPGGTVYWGNDFTSPFNDNRDRINNIESILINSPTPGKYYVNVTGYNCPRGPQPFAVALSGPIGTSVGAVTFDKTEYTSISTPQVTLRDVDLQGTGTTTLNVFSTTDPTGETITLTETPANSATFIGTVQLTSNTPGAGEVQVTVTDTLTAFYFDFNPVGVRQDTASIGYLPHIYNVSHDGLSILTQGDVLEVWLTGDPFYTASWSLDGLPAVNNYTLYDDGLHNDGFPDDGIYGANWTVGPSIWGDFTLYGFLRSGSLDANWSTADDPVRINTSLPSAPKGLSVTPAIWGNQLNLTWNANPQPNIAHYTVYRNDSAGPGGSYMELGQTALLKFEEYGLTDGTVYYYKLTASNTQGYDSGYSPPVPGIPWDSLGPKVNFTNPAPDVSIGGNYNIQYTTDNDTQLIEFGYYNDTNGDHIANDGNNWVMIETTTDIDGDLGWDTTLTSGVGPGDQPHVLLRAIALDEVPNVGPTIMVNVSVDNTPPGTPVLLDTLPPITNQNPILIQGIGEPNGFIQVIVNDIIEVEMWPVGVAGGFTAEVEPDFEGLHTIQVRAFDEAHNGPSAKSNKISTITDYTPPVAMYKGSVEVEIGNNTFLDGSSSHDVDPHPSYLDLANHTWSFNEKGKMIYIYNQSFYYTFQELKNYSITLDVFDSAGNHDSEAVDIGVVDTTPPKPHAGKNVVTEEGIEIFFNANLSTDNDPEFYSTATFKWYITGPVTVNKQGILSSYVFTKPGNHTVKLEVTDRSGNSANTSIWVQVSDLSAPHAIAGDDLNITVGQMAFFNASETTDNDPNLFKTGKFEWSFTYNNKTETLTGSLTSFRFEIMGDYVITLIVTDAAGNSGTDTLTVKVVADKNAPYITSRNPKPGTHDVSSKVVIYAIFSEQLLNTSIDLNNAITVQNDVGQNIVGKIKYIKNEKKLLFTPDNNLGIETKFTVKVSTALKDLGGNKLVDTVTWNFWTSDSPYVVSTSPADLAVNVSISIGKIICVFSEEINIIDHDMVMQISEMRSGKEIFGEALRDELDHKRIILEIFENLTYNTSYWVTISHLQITDELDNPMLQNHVFEFITELDPTEGPVIDDDVVDDDTGDDDGMWEKVKDNMEYILGTIIIIVIVLILVMILGAIILSRRKKDEEEKEKKRSRDDDYDDDYDDYDDDFDHDDDWDDDWDDKPKKRSRDYDDHDDDYDDEYEDDYDDWGDEDDYYDYNEPRGSSGRRSRKTSDEADFYEPPVADASRRKPSRRYEDDFDDDDDYDDYDDDDDDGYWDRRASRSRKEDKSSSDVDWESEDDDYDDDDWDDDYDEDDDDDFY